MSRTGWAISSKKLPKLKSESSAGKRRRNSATSTRNPTTSHSQPTLTQVEWVPRLARSFSDATMHLRSGESTGSRHRQSRSSKKQRSTLTQMDFLKRRDDEVDFDDTMLPPIRQPQTGLSIPQLDGAYVSPRKPRPKKQSLQAQSQPVDAAEQESQSQEYQPNKRRKTSHGSIEVEPTRRRTSSRLTKKILSDPAQNYSYFEEALSNDKPRQAPRLQQRRPLLEIQDSTDIGHEVSPPRPKYLQPAPQTPEARRTIVLSSQSPESLRTVSRRKNSRAVVDGGEARSPLGELDTNQLMKNYDAGEDDAEVKQTSRSRKQSRLSTVSRTSRKRRIEDSQTDVYSIQPTSSQAPDQDVSSGTPLQIYRTADSPNAHAVSPLKHSARVPTKKRHEDVRMTQASLPDIGLNTQASLPDLTTLLGVTTQNARSIHETRGIDPTTPMTSRVTIKDFAPRISEASRTDEALDNSPEGARKPPRNSDRASRLHPSPSAKTEEWAQVNGHDVQGDEEDDESVSDFGSPVANDTQFHAIVAHNTSSPDLLRHLNSSEQRKRLSDTVPISSPTLQLDLTNINHDRRHEIVNAGKPDALPEPRLVPRQASSRPSTAASNESPELPQLPIPVPHSETRHTSVKIPLNDTSTSSVSSVEHRSFNPAELPNPSQMSTQEPTQRMSSIRRTQSEQERSDRITIKDSSSMQISLSQIPQHHPSDEAEEEDDFDLDPFSEPQLPHLPTPQNVRRFEPLVEQPDSTTPKASRANHHRAAAAEERDLVPPPSSSELLTSSPMPSPVKRKHSPIPGFDNDTQSNFTQEGHVTAAYIHRQREKGALPDWYTPKPYQVKNYKCSSRRKRKKQAAKENADSRA